jgi:enoyl-CoA hydratase/carnithine racemase
MSEPVLIDADAGVGVVTITIADVERENRITVRAMRLLIEGLRSATETNARVLVLRAEGPDFTLGRDQSERPEGLTRLESLRLILEANALLAGFPGISVAAIQGRALGFGSGLAAQSDITLAADDATFGFDEVLHGLAPLVVAEYLPRFVGEKVAGELIYTGRPVPAFEALSLGLVNRLVRSEQLAGETDTLVNHLLGLEPGALRLMKRYGQDLRAGRMAEPREAAVTRLDAWIDAGRPAA